MIKIYTLNKLAQMGGPPMPPPPPQKLPPRFFNKVVKQMDGSWGALFSNTSNGNIEFIPEEKIRETVQKLEKENRKDEELIKAIARFNTIKTEDRLQDEVFNITK